MPTRPQPITDSAFGVGVYSLREAGNLLAVDPITIKRWVGGYEYDHHGPRKSQPPVWTPQYAIDEDEILLGFRDLMEARVVRSLRSLGIGLPYIREFVARATEIIGATRPFSTSAFRSDGKNIFLEVTEGTNEPHLIDPVRCQHVFRTIVAPTFVDLEFDNDAAARWWPTGGRRTVVIDPTMSFGQPIVAANGIRTRMVVDAVKAEGSVERAARIYDLKPKAVRDALHFEATQGYQLAA